MLAVFFIWLFATAVLQAVTVLPTWLCALLPAVVLVYAMIKRPEWF